MEAINPEIKELLKAALSKQAKYCERKSELQSGWYHDATIQVDCLKKVIRALHGEDAEAIIKNIYEEGEREFNSQ